MADIETPKTDPLFLMGFGHSGAILFDIQSGPCLRLDEKRWSLNTSRGNLVLSQMIVDRLTQKGLVAISEMKIMERETLELTPEGTKELMNYALRRSMEIAGALDPVTLLAANGRDTSQSPQAIAFDLASKAFDLDVDRRMKAGEDYVAIVFPGRLAVLVARDPDRYETVEEFLNKPDTKPGKRCALLFHLIKELAESSMFRLTIGDMDSIARWGGIMAAEAFERAPDQDWEVGTEGDGEGGDA